MRVRDNFREENKTAELRKAMDQRFLQLAESADYAASIIGNAETRDYLLLDLRQPAPSCNSETVRTVIAYHMRYLGVVGIVEGVPRVVLGVPLDPDSISLLTHSFVRRIEAETNPLRIVAGVEKPDDFLQFMQSLWALKDLRLEP
jgi:hypothetical protein